MLIPGAFFVPRGYARSRGFLIRVRYIKGIFITEISTGRRAAGTRRDAAGAPFLSTVSLE